MEFFSIFIGSDNKEINTINNNGLITFTPQELLKFQLWGQVAHIILELFLLEIKF